MRPAADPHTPRSGTSPKTSADATQGGGTPPPLDAEWIEADGLGGFSSGTVAGHRTRRYHALLLTATTPPAGRMVLVNGFDAFVETPHGTFALSTQQYAPGVTHPDGATRLESFSTEPWPRWTWRIAEALWVVQEIFAVHGKSAVCVSWRAWSGARPAADLDTPGSGTPSRGAAVAAQGDGTSPLLLRVRPFLSGRDFHGTHHENGAFRFDATASFESVEWNPYDGVPAIHASSNGRYVQEPCWYRNFLYAEEAARGLDCREDLASPGIFEWELGARPAVWMLAAEGHRVAGMNSTEESFSQVREMERARRARFTSPLHRPADAYLVKRGTGSTIVAGYPWFGDWGRDTFIALRGLCLATGRLEEARDILVEWAGAVSEGMLPNRFPDHGEKPEFNSVDASLWYVVAVHEYLFLAAQQRPAEFVTDCHTKQLRGAVEAILTGYRQGTRFGIRADADGLLACGEPGVQLTWMDAKVGNWVVTPRIGKPVEVQALWLNALWIGGQWSSKWKKLFAKAKAAFEARFWNEATGGLFDVVDCDHRAGVDDAAIRPNQIFAVGGLPLPLIEGDRARRIVETVEAKLLTPVGLRSLAPGEPGYAPRYEGDVVHRDGAYHQGTVWPWLMGPFVEAWLRVRGNTPFSRAGARMQFIEPLRQHLGVASFGHVSEIADAEPPHTPRGCPFQAWSLAELLRIEAILPG
ncbi:MAG: amylo-alpha-1,6-glucosidase [Verrucomicrobiales bacterium]